jgi:biotin carboxyl carrier protein
MKIDAQIGDATHAVEIDEAAGRFRLVVDGREYEGEVLRPEPGVYTFFVGARVVEARVGALAGSDALRVRVGEATTDVRMVDRKRRAAGGEAGVEGRQTLAAPMPGKVVAILVEAGGEVERGQGVLVVEAMKMQNEVKAPKAGVVAEVRVSVGDTVNAGQALAVID